MNLKKTRLLHDIFSDQESNACSWCLRLQEIKVAASVVFLTQEHYSL